MEEYRTTLTPTLKSGAAGKTKVTYGEPEEPLKWLWRWLDGAGTAGELYGRGLVVFAAQHYALQLVLPASKRRGSVAPRSHKDIARKALERIVKPVLPASHTQLVRALEREARNHTKRAATTKASTPAGDVEDIAPEDEAFEGEADILLDEDPVS